VKVPAVVELRAAAGRAAVTVTRGVSSISGSVGVRIDSVAGM